MSGQDQSTPKRSDYCGDSNRAMSFLYLGGFVKLVPGLLIMCRCSSVPSATCHFCENFFAHRVSPNFPISGIILHRCSVIYFLTDLKKSSSLESYDISKLGNICFRSSYEFSLYRKSNRNWNQTKHFPLDFL